MFVSNSKIILSKRKGTSDDPFVNINESHVINTDGKVILSEIPNQFQGVTVTGDSKTWFQIESGVPSPNQYLIDYRGRTVTFNIANIGKQLSFNYLGEGLYHLPSDMIYTKEENGTVVETLKDLTDSTVQAMEDAIAATADVQNQANYAKQQGDYAKGKIDNFGHKGNYSPATSYKNGNIVAFGGTNYICVQDTTAGIDPLNGTYWTVVAPQATINTKTWTATANQSVFTITNGSYVTGKGNIEVYVGGVPQISGQGFTETNSTTITLSEGVPVGTNVFAKWFEGAMSITKSHGTGHEKGGQDELDITKLKNYQEMIATPLADIVLGDYKNLKYTAIGDSISNSDVVSFGVTNSYSKMVSQTLKMTYNDLSFGGTCVAVRSGDNNSSFVYRVQNDRPIGTGEAGNHLRVGADNKLITVFGGHNDFAYNIPLGKPNSSNTSEFFGALNYIADTLLTTNPDAEIIFMTPMTRYDVLINSLGLTMDDYSEAVRIVANSKCIPICDTHNECQLNAGIEAIRVKYRPDKLHPNQLGQNRLYKLLIKKIQYGI